MTIEKPNPSPKDGRQPAVPPMPPPKFHRMVPNLMRSESPYKEDVAVLRKLLNEYGYDADDETIAWAYGEVSESCFAAGWMPLERMVLGPQLVTMLITFMKPDEECKDF